MIYPVARLPDDWVEQARLEGAHIDFSLKSPWRLWADFDGNEAHGFIGLLLLSERRATVRGWYVFPEHRGRGYGTGLLTAAVDWGFRQGMDRVEIRTPREVEWAGFEWTGAETVKHEKHYRLPAANWGCLIGA